MIDGERARPDRVELVTIATPNASHFPIARAFLEAGIPVLCEKPVATTSADALDLCRIARRAGLIGAVMYGYTGYPLVRQARAMVRGGALGRIRVVRAEFAHGGHVTEVERDSPGTAWRYDPAVAGPSGVLADAGSHPLHMIPWIIGQDVTEVSAHFDSVVPSRALEDNAFLTLRYDGGAVGTLWASAVALGHRHGLRWEIFGDRASLAWQQEDPNRLIHCRLGESPQVIERDGPGADPWARRSGRVSGGHSEGYFVAFANIYRDLADAIAARRAGEAYDAASCGLPDLLEGARGVRCIEAAVESAARQGAWVSARLPDPAREGSEQ
jgi:predicted dehydrogenase